MSETWLRSYMSSAEYFNDHHFTFYISDLTRGFSIYNISVNIVAVKVFSPAGSFSLLNIYIPPDLISNGFAEVIQRLEDVLIPCKNPILTLGDFHTRIFCLVQDVLVCDHKASL